jgi:hypothetical protein
MQKTQDVLITALVHFIIHIILLAYSIAIRDTTIRTTECPSFLINKIILMISVIELAQMVVSALPSIMKLKQREKRYVVTSRLVLEVLALTLGFTVFYFLIGKDCHENQWKWFRTWYYSVIRFTVIHLMIYLIMLVYSIILLLKGTELHGNNKDRDL